MECKNFEAQYLKTTRNADRTLQFQKKKKKKKKSNTIMCGVFLNKLLSQ